MPVWFRNADRRWPFLWEDASQPPGRWHGPGSGPAQCLADTPDGAWAEFLRHEEITDPVDLEGIARHLWAIEDSSDEEEPAAPDLPGSVLQGGLDSYLQVLDAESRLFDAELRLAQLRRDELLAIVQLYRALGGGWAAAG